MTDLPAIGFKVPYCSWRTASSHHKLEDVPSSMDIDILDEVFVARAGRDLNASLHLSWRRARGRRS